MIDSIQEFKHSSVKVPEDLERQKALTGTFNSVDGKFKLAELKKAVPGRNFALLLLVANPLSADAILMMVQQFPSCPPELVLSSSPN